MIKTVFNAQDVYLLNDEPDWDSPVSAQVELLSNTTTGLTQREARRPYSTTLRFSKVSYVTSVQDLALRELAEALRDLQTQPVIMPLWPAAVAWADRATRPIGGNLNVVWKDDWSAWSIYDSSVAGPGFAPGASDWIAPALFGRLEKREVSLLTPTTADFSVEFVESSPAGPINPAPTQFAITPAAVAWTAGPRPSMAYAVGAVKLLPVAANVNFEGPTVSRDVAIIREQIGFSRDPLETLYPQTNVRGSGLPVVCASGSDVGKLLRFFSEYGGGKVFWAGELGAAIILAANVGAADTALAVDDSSTVRVGDWLWVDDAAGSARVLSVGAGVVNLEAAFGVAFSKGSVVSQLALVRFQEAKIQVDWSAPGLAECALSLREVPPEYTPAGDETLGTTLGLLPTRVYLYELSRTLNATLVTDYFTSHEQQVVGAHTYNPCKMSHGTIEQSLMLDADKVELETFTFSGPLLDIATMRMEAPLFLTVKSADLDGTGGFGFVNVNAPSVAVLFVGEVETASVKGSTITASAISGGSIFDRMIPRCRFQLGCNNSLFDAGCKQDSADWNYTGKVHADYVPGSLQIVIDTLVAAASAPAPAALPLNWLALGWIEVLFAGTVTEWQIRPILTSSVTVAGVVTLAIDRDFDPVPLVARMTGGGPLPDAVRLFPGCDGSFATCQTKFSNSVNFIGQPYMPLANPSLVKSNPNAATGKK